MEEDYLQQQEVLVEWRANSRAAVLNRPHALNALTPKMATRLNKLYELKYRIHLDEGG